MSQSETIYSEPRVTLAAKGLLEDPPKIDAYREAVAITVNEVVAAIKKRIELEMSSGKSREIK